MCIRDRSNLSCEVAAAVRKKFPTGMSFFVTGLAVSESPSVQPQRKVEAAMHKATLAHENFIKGTSSQAI